MKNKITGFLNRSKEKIFSDENLIGNYKNTRGNDTFLKLDKVIIQLEDEVEKYKQEYLKQKDYELYKKDSLEEVELQIKVREELLNKAKMENDIDSIEELNKKLEGYYKDKDYMIRQCEIETVNTEKYFDTYINKKESLIKFKEQRDMLVAKAEYIVNSIENVKVKENVEKAFEEVTDTSGDNEKVYETENENSENS